MANFRKLLLQTLIFVFVALITEHCEARGGRGGGARGGGYRSGARGSSRSGGSSSYRGRRGVSNTRGFSSSAAFKTAMLGGYLYGSTRYMRRRRYYDNPDEEPTICTNYNLKYENGSSNVYGKFICPMYNQDEDMEWCCGEDNSETCCTYWDDPGRTAGTVIGILVGVAVIGAFVYFCCLRKMCGQKPDLAPQAVAMHTAPPGYPVKPPPVSVEHKFDGPPAEPFAPPQYGFNPAVMSTYEKK